MLDLCPVITLSNMPAFLFHSDTMASCTALGIVVKAMVIMAIIISAVGELDGMVGEVVPAQFDTVVSANISSTGDGLLRLKYELTNMSSVVRVWVQSVDASNDDPLLVVVREPRSIISWQVPLPLENRFFYNAVSRTLCPRNISALAEATNDSIVDEPQIVYVEFSTSSTQPIAFNATASLMPHFLLNLDERKTVNVSSSQPQIFGFMIPDGVDSVVLHTRSNDRKCLVVSIQDAKCPVFDLDTNVMTVGTYQTMTRKSAIVIQRNVYPQFFVVLVVKPDDYSCTGMYSITSPSSMPDISRMKTVEVWVENATSYKDYILAISVTLATFSIIYLVTFALWALYLYRDMHDPYLVEARRRVLEGITNGETQPLLQSSDVFSSTYSETGITYGSINRRQTSGSSNEQPPVTRSDERRHTDGGSEDAAAGPSTLSDQISTRKKKSIDEVANAEDGLESGREEVMTGISSEYDVLSDATEDKTVIRIKTKLVVADLARKAYSKLNRKYSMYHWNLMTIAIFYTLPVIQLVLTYQKVVSVTGNEDLCYYNFECARPLGQIFAFNSVFSNIGYVLFGILFLFLVKIRDVRHQHFMKENEILETKYGIPRHYGLFYAMGIALVMEGVLSASYHICPNYTNFQFDTAFMYMIAALSMLKIYQIRHPDINAHSHVAYVVMALIILIAVVGVVYNSIGIWVVFAVGFIILMFMISAEFYYKSQWKIDRGIFQRVRQEWSSTRGLSKLRPMYPDRMIYLILCNGMNMAFVIYGLIKRPTAFAAYLVLIFIANLMLYLAFYIGMKIRHRERLKKRAIAIGLLAVATWAGSACFFFDERISWMRTPSGSRELNAGCILFGFYDTHDIWHYLSSLALFLSFMLTMVMDDDLTYTPQDKIAVF